MIESYPTTGEGVKRTSELPIEFKQLLLENGKMNDLNTKSEYERGYIDCWNFLSDNV